MIRVNLLPQEYRKVEATPLKQFFATVGAVVVAALAVVGWLYVHYGELEPTRQELANIENSVKTQMPNVKLSKDLAGWVQEYKSQYGKIDEVAENRVVWSRKTDALWDLVITPPTQNKYEVWLSSLECRLNPTAKSGGDLKFGGTSAGTQVFRMSDFNEAIKTSEFFKDFTALSYPFGQREPLPGSDREPKEGWKFTGWTATLRPLKELKEARLKAAEGASAGGKK
jgi:hypothetical protein